MRIVVSALLLALLSSSVYAQKGRTGRLKPGVPAVDFTLQDAFGKKTVRLSELKGKPVVLIFGSSTSRRFVESVPVINKFHTAYRDAAHVFVVYVREVPGKKVDNVPIPKTLEQRQRVARDFAERVKLSAPVLVDTMDNQVDNAYAGWPDRTYVIDASGTIVHKSNYTLDGFGPALSATPFILYKLTSKSLEAFPVPAQRSRDPREGDPAPDFTLRDTQGKMAVKLSDLKGKPVVLIFGSCT